MKPTFRISSRFSESCPSGSAVLFHGIPPIGGEWGPGRLPGAGALPQPKDSTAKSDWVRIFTKEKHMRTISVGIQGLLVGAGMLISASAFAQSRAAVLIDQTGSMRADAVGGNGCATGETCEAAPAPDYYSPRKCVASGSTYAASTKECKTRWADALDAAAVEVTAFKAANRDDLINHTVGIWTFQNTNEALYGNQAPQPQAGLRQIWPTQASDCATASAYTATTFTEYGGTSRVYKSCALTMPAHYQAVLNKLQALKTSAAERPYGDTPLSQGFCEIVEDLKIALGSGGSNKTVVFASDGGENNTPATHRCAGASHPTFTLNQAVADWGMTPTEPKTWQLIDLRRASHTKDTFLTAINEAIPAQPFPIESDFDYKMKVSLDFFGVGAAAYRTMSLAAAPAPAPAVDLSVLEPSQRAALAKGGSVALRSLAAPSPMALTAAAAAPSAYPNSSVPEAEMNFFAALSKLTPKSSLQVLARDVNATTPVCGSVAAKNGDLNRNGKVDTSDYLVIKNLLNQFAQDPASPAAVADLNGDCWVNDADKALFLTACGANCAQGGLLSFETAWSTINGTSTYNTTNWTEGTRALQPACGYTLVRSPAFTAAKVGGVSNNLKFDVYVPSAVQNWGYVELLISVPKANLTNISIGQFAISTLRKDAWTQGSFALPAFIVTAMQAAGNDIQIGLATNSGACSSPVLLDNIRF